jgi:hypothetical protein
MDKANNIITRIQSNVYDYFDKTSYLNSNSLLTKVIIFYIIYMLTKDIIKGLITVILYTIVIVYAITYTYKSINNKQKLTG